MAERFVVPARARQPSSILVVLLLLAACGAPGPSETRLPTSVPTPDPFNVVIPSREEFVPAAVAGVTEWMAMPSLPDGFDARIAYRSASAAGEAFGSALAMALGAGGNRPSVRVDAFRESDELALLVVTEEGVGDDSVAGSQYALDFVHEPDGWTLYQTWIRTLCRRGVDASGEFCT